MISTLHRLGHWAYWHPSNRLQPNMATGMICKMLIVSEICGNNACAFMALSGRIFTDLGENPIAGLQPIRLSNHIYELGYFPRGSGRILQIFNDTFSTQMRNKIV
jgi:hypothetical protein